MTGPAGRSTGGALAGARRARWRSSERRGPVGAERLRRLPPYLFAQIEQKIAAKRAEGVDIISLGIGDPDTPTPAPGGRRDARAGGAPGHPPVPLQPGARLASARPWPSSTPRRFGVDARPGDRDHPGAGRQGGRRQRQPGLPRPRRRRPGERPRLPGLHHRAAAGRAPSRCPCPSLPELGFQPDLEAIPADVAARARMMFLNYPNNPTGGGDRGRLLRARGRVRATPRPDRRARQRLLRDHLRRLPRARRSSRRRAPRTSGIEIFSLSKTYNMTGWRAGRRGGQRRPGQRLLAAQDQHRQRHVRGPPGGRRRRPALRPVVACARCARSTSAAATCWSPRSAAIGLRGEPARRAPSTSGPACPRATPRPSFTERVLEQAAVVISPGAAYGPSGEGFVRMSLTVPDERLNEAADRIAAPRRPLERRVAAARVRRLRPEAAAARARPPRRRRPRPVRRRGLRDPPRRPGSGRHRPRRRPPRRPRRPGAAPLGPGPPGRRHARQRPGPGRRRLPGRAASSSWSTSAPSPTGSRPGTAWPSSW